MAWHHCTVLYEVTSRTVVSPRANCGCVINGTIQNVLKFQRKRKNIIVPTDCPVLLGNSPLCFFYLFSPLSINPAVGISLLSFSFPPKRREK